ncbi:MAG: alanine racemase [Clostridia bacterium]|nr:alanine racemase [Clostridia bacterium]
MQKTVAEINLKAIKENAQAFVERTGAKLCAVVQANAYGHGATEVVSALTGVAECFAVAIVEEGIAIKPAACGKEILVFTPPSDETEAAAIIKEGFTACAVDYFSAQLLASVAERLGKRVKVHLKVNTGMNRYGMGENELKRVCRFLSKQKFVLVEGVFSHLYQTRKRTAEKQRELFLRLTELCRSYYPNATRHLSATYGALLGEAFAFDMVRIGIGLYGYLPCEKKLLPKPPRLQKAMKVYARVLLNRRYAFGGAGYGEDFSGLIKKGGWLNLLRVGYADGFLRRKRNGTDGAEKNANNLCMDICIRKGRATKGEWIPVMTDAEKTAKKTGTICYEVLCAATSRAERRYLYE